jgi:hypothetical protein
VDSGLITNALFTYVPMYTFTYIHICIDSYCYDICRIKADDLIWTFLKEKGRKILLSSHREGMSLNYISAFNL